jgi:hypothetical protein
MKAANTRAPKDVLSRWACWESPPAQAGVGRRISREISFNEREIISALVKTCP